MTGKRIVPVCTSEGGGMGRSGSDLRKICTGAVVEQGLAIRGTEAAKSGKEVSAWANGFVHE